MNYKRSTLMQERIEQNRKAILQAGKQLIAQNGIKGAQIQAIAEIAGVSTGLVYRYFNNKNQVIIEVLSMAIATELEVLTAIAQSDLPYPARLHKAVKTFVRRALNSPQLAYALMLEPAEAEVEEARYKSKQLIREIIQQLLDAGQHQGDFHFDDVTTTALCIVGAMTFAVVEPLSLAQQAQHQDAFSTQVANFCLQSVSSQTTMV